jgi:hypothetical protein
MMMAARLKGVLVGMEGQSYSYYIFFMEIVFLVGGFKRDVEGDIFM